MVNYSKIGYSSIDEYSNDFLNTLLESNHTYEFYVNWDKVYANLEDKVVVKGYVDTQHEGIYKLEYTVSDSSNNKTSKTREVIVKKPIITLSNSTNGYQCDAFKCELYGTF